MMMMALFVANQAAGKAAYAFMENVHRMFTHLGENTVTNGLGNSFSRQLDFVFSASSISR